MAAPLDVKPVFKTRGKREIACRTVVKKIKSSKPASQAERDQIIALTAINKHRYGDSNEAHNGNASPILANKTTPCCPHIRSTATRIKLTTITGTTMVSQIGHNEGHENKAVTSYADRATEASLSVHRLIGGH